MITIYDELVEEFKLSHRGRHPMEEPTIKLNPKRAQKARNKAKRRSATILREARTSTE